MQPDTIPLSGLEKQAIDRTCGDIALACCFIRAITSVQTVLTRESQCAEGTFTFCSATTEHQNQTRHPRPSITASADWRTLTSTPTTRPPFSSGPRFWQATWSHAPGAHPRSSTAAPGAMSLCCFCIWISCSGGEEKRVA